MGLLISLLDKSPILQAITILLVIINLGLLFGGICGDPGVKKETYLLTQKLGTLTGKRCLRMTQMTRMHREKMKVMMMT